MCAWGLSLIFRLTYYLMKTELIYFLIEYTTKCFHFKSIHLKRIVKLPTIKNMLVMKKINYHNFSSHTKNFCKIPLVSGNDNRLICFQYIFCIVITELPIFSVNTQLCFQFILWMAKAWYFKSIDLSRRAEPHCFKKKSVIKKKKKTPIR